MIYILFGILCLVFLWFYGEHHTVKVEKQNALLHINDSGLTQEQLTHNHFLDLEIKSAHEFNERITKENNRKIMEWNEYRKKRLAENPDLFIPSFPPGLDFRYKTVIGIRYV